MIHNVDSRWELKLEEEEEKEREYVQLNIYSQWYSLSFSSWNRRRKKVDTIV